MACVTLLLLTLPAWAGAQGAPLRLTISQAVGRALEASPQMDQAKERLTEARAGLSQARLAALPRLSAKSSAVRSDDPVFAFSSLLEQRRFTAADFAVDALNNPGYFTNIKSSLELGVPLFTGFALTDQRKLGRLQVESADAGARQAADRTREQAAEAYLRLLLGRALLGDAEERIGSARSEIEEARRLRERGLVLGSDFYAAQAVLGSLEAERARLRGELSATQAALGVMLKSDGPIEPVGRLAEAAYSTAPVSDLLGRALSERQDLRQAGVAESSAKILERRQRLSVLPTVDAFAALETDTYDFGSSAANRAIGVRLALPFGDPAYFESSKRAAAAARAASAGKQAAEQDARIEVEQRYAEFEAAAATLPILQDAAAKAQRSLELFRPLYREGRQSIFDVLRAELALMQTRAAYLQTVFQVHAGYARLQLAAGRLGPEQIDEIERRLGGAP